MSSIPATSSIISNLISSLTPLLVARSKNIGIVKGFSLPNAEASVSDEWSL